VLVSLDGFVAIHDATQFEGDAVGSVIGVSEPLDPADNATSTCRCAT
jgi:hypothetical protein